jgi:hypothetical protein
VIRPTSTARRRYLPAALAVAVAVLLVAGIIAAVSESGGSGGPPGAAPGGEGGTEAAPVPTRDVYQRPFAWSSPWNLPLATAAATAPAGLTPKFVQFDAEHISASPTDPVRTLTSGETVTVDLNDYNHSPKAENVSTRVHVNPRDTADGGYNNCSAFLVDSPDRQTVVQGQPLKLDPGGNPSYDFGWGPIRLTGDGIVGCHGGSGLSGIGGAIRVGEMRSADPLTHALKIGVNCETECSNANRGFRWPAYKADKGYEDKYKGPNPNMGMGSLLALPADADLAGITEPDTRKVAEALKTYGGYIVDETANPGNFIAVQSGVEAEMPDINSPQMQRLFRQLQVVTNNGPTTPGGGPLGSPRRGPCAPAFADGTGGAPSGC